jgi:hypothetical protein
VIVDDGHQGGRFDATDKQKTAMGKQIADTLKVCLLTEAVGFDPPPGWGQIRGETKVLFDRKVWRRTESGKLVIPTPEWVRGTDRRDTVEFTWGLLTDAKTRKRTLLRGGGHWPAHLTDRAQKAANDAVLAQMGPLLADLIKQTKPDETSFSWDVNRDLRLERNRALVTKALKGTGLHLVVPPQATFGAQRKIDCFAISSALWTRHMLARKTGFDHRGAWLRYHLDAC